MKHRIKTPAVLVSLLLFLLFIPISLMSAASQDSPEIASVRASESSQHMLVTASLPPSFLAEHDGEMLYLFALSPAEIGKPLDTLIPIATQRIEKNDKAIEVSFRFYRSGQYADRLFARYQLALQENDSYIAMGEGRYIDSVELIAKVKTPYPAVASKKGLQTQMYADAQILGVAHTTIPVAVNELISSTETAYSFVYLNKTYYLNASQIKLLDYKILRLSQANTRVYLNLLLTESSDEALSYLYYSQNSTEAQFYAYHVENEKAAHLLEGLVQFLTDRYTRADQKYGFAAGFIVGYEVNSNRFRNFRGPYSLEQYAASYARLIRLVSTAARSVYSESRVYISLANNWNTVSIDSSVVPNPLLEYSSYDFLCEFNTAMLAQGDPIPWSVAINPYPSDVSMTNFLNDTQATAALDSPYLTMKNIEVLTTLLASDPFLENKTERTVLISEFGLSGQIGTESEDLQAAAFAYAYYKAVSLPQIEAMIWHRQVDRIGENQLYYGLWSSDYSNILAPVEKKRIYEVFRYIDTGRMLLHSEEDIAAFAPALLGAQDWEELLPGFSLAQAKKTLFYETVPVLSSSLTSMMHEKTVYRFAQGNLYNFFPSDSAAYIEIREDDTYGHILYTKLFSTDSVEYAGIASYSAKELSVSGQSYLRLQLMANHGASKEKIPVMLRLTGKNANGDLCVYEGVAQIAPKQWTTLTFPIEEFSKAVQKIDGIRIWIRGHASDDEEAALGECQLSLASVSLLSPSRFSPIHVIVQIVIGITIPAGLGFIAYLIKQRINKAVLKKRKRSHRGQEHRYHIQKRK